MEVLEYVDAYGYVCRAVFDHRHAIDAASQIDVRMVDDVDMGVAGKVARPAAEMELHGL